MNHQAKRLATAAVFLGLALPVDAETALLNSFESDARATLQEALNGKLQGVGDIVNGYSIYELSRADALSLALKQSPQILANDQSRQIATSKLTEQNALFDWTLALSASFTSTDFNERTETINRERVTGFTISGDQPSVGDTESEPVFDEDGAPVVVSDSVGNLLCITIAGEIANPDQCAFSTEVSEKEEYASADSDATNAWSFGLSGSRNFHLGSQLELGLSLSRRTKNFYPLDDLGLLAPVSVEDPIGNGSRYPWTTTVFLQYATPLPFAKNFGKNGSVAALGVQLASLANEKSLHTEHSVREQLLQQIDNAWWQLSRNLMRLQSAKNNQNNLIQRLDAAQRRYDLREITNFEYAQVQASLASSNAREQSAWVGFIQSSEQLVGLLGIERGSVIFPMHVSESVKPTERLDKSALLDAVSKNNPSLQADRLAVLSSQAVEKNAEQNMKPDLNVVVRFELSQSDRVLGYESAGDSLSNSLNPDNSNWFVGLTYQYPFGKNAEKARRFQSKIRLSQARIAVKQNEVALATRVSQTVVGMDTLIANTEHAALRVELANDAFERATRERSSAQISEYEYLQIVDNLESAQLAWIDQLVSQQTLYSTALALQGKLMSESGEGL